MDNIHTAVKELRRELNLSQQALATKLNMSVRAIANYEKDRVPVPRVVGRLGRLAQKHDLYVLAETFRMHIAEAVNEIPARIPSSKREQTLTDLLLIASRNGHVHGVSRNLQLAAEALVRNIGVLLAHNEDDLNDTGHDELERIRRDVDKLTLQPAVKQRRRR